MVNHVCRVSVLVMGLALMMAGCSGGTDVPDPVPVTGKVTLNGKPVDGAMISFTAISEGLPGNLRYSHTTTNKEGVYTLPEVYPAEYLVQVSKADPNASASPEGVVANPSANTPFALYGAESPLRAKVTTEATTFDFELAP